MPIDYSKFDSIEDSDEEKEAARGPAAAASAIRAAASAAGGAGGQFAPSARAAPSAGPHVGREGRPLLEPVGLEQQLQLVDPSIAQDGPSEMELLAQQMGMLGGPSGEGAATEGAAEADPSQPKRLCMRADGRKKIHTTYPDGSEMVEEFDERTDVLMLRKVRKASVLSNKEPEWVFEVGQPPEPTFDPHADFLRASSSNPIFLRKDTPEHFQWRIRNLSYPASVYSVTVDDEKQQVVVRTSNKKYFKRIDVPDLTRLGLKLEDAKLSWKHQHNTLIISYTRPAEVAAQEQEAIREAERSALRM